MRGKRHFKSWERAIQKLAVNENDKQALKQSILNGTKYINTMEIPNDKEGCEEHFKLLSSIKVLMSRLSPAEFMQLFPLTKSYDGKKYGCKDYYSALEYINTLDEHEPIGENISMFIMEYVNEDVEDFNIHQVLCLNKIRQLDGHLHLLEEFQAMEGEQTENTFRNSKNQVFFIRNGKPEKIKVSRHLRLVK